MIDGRERDLGGGMIVKRVLPSSKRRMVGPFIFFDQMGPAKYSPGTGMDVRPHPHIGLATMTYLFEGSILHRDSLGTTQLIEPGAVNWMIAGKGIVHSERTPIELRENGGSLFGIQCWIALPTSQEDHEPLFQHCSASSIPEFKIGTSKARLLAGSAFGYKSPVKVLSDIFYLEVILKAGEEISLPASERELGVYLVNGSICSNQEKIAEGSLLCSSPGDSLTILAENDSRVMLLGGAPLQGERYIFWNFVSSSEEKLAEAKQMWRDQRFPKIPGDDTEFIPLPS